MFSEHAPLLKLATLLDQQVEVVADTRARTYISAGFASLGTQYGKLDVFLGVAVRQSLVEVSNPELFPSADYLDIRTVLEERPEIGCEVGSGSSSK